MFPSYQDLIKDTSAAIAKLRGEIPDTMRGFSAMAQGASKPGVLDANTQALVKLGCTREELAETLAMAVYMGGGPSLMYAARTSAAFDEFAQAAQKTTA
jgi:alkylhydroperoxidase/carboxymuconolactone decarboxylase family protein YurZ